MFFKLSNLNSNLALTLGYLNPALNNSAPIIWYGVYEKNKKTPEGVYKGCVGVSENYVKWYWKVEQCTEQQMFAGETVMFC